MEFSLQWSTDAQEDLRDIRKHLEGKAPSRAGATISTIQATAEKVCTFPLSGRKLPEMPDGTLREVLSSPYRIIYEVQSAHIVVLNVLHERRQVNLERFADRSSEA